MSGDYLTAAGPGEAEYEDRRSRFLAHVRPVSSEAEARAFLDEIRRLTPDANHHVWALVLRDGTLRWSDDGEPGGTAGQPTLGVLRGEGLEDVCCVTARYFGGTLLGSGGLVRAYAGAARLAVRAAGAARMTPWLRGGLRCAYAQYDRLRRFLTERGAQVEDSAFGEDVELIVSAPEGLAESLARGVRDLTAGAAEPRWGETVMRPVRE